MKIGSLTRLWLGCAIAACVLSGQNPAPQQEQKPPASAEEKPEVTAASPGAAVDPRSYKIGPEDVLLLRIWREPD